jgi:hypothetical protein
MSTLDYNGNQSISDITGISGGTPDTGEMRRKYNFSEQFTELALDQTPFFRLVSKIGNKPTDDPQFKFTEKRQSWMKRYAYCIGAGDATTAGLDGDLDASETHLYMATDYKNQGNIQNVIGQAGVEVGDAGTMPKFYLKNQVIKVNYASTAGGGFADYALYKVSAVVEGWLCHTVADSNAVGDFVSAAPDTLASYYEVAQLAVDVVKDVSAASRYLTSYNSSSVLITDVAPNSDGSNSISNELEVMRSYVTGTAYGEGSTLMEMNWADQPYSVGYGYTQIFRSEFGMSNSARATALKYEKNEWARLWRDKLIEHKWEIEQTALFGKQGVSSNVQYTQGAVDYVLTNGNLFDLDHDIKSSDDFLEDLSMLVDPRYNNSKKMVFFCDTATYNWLHKLGGYFQNNLEKSPNFSSSFAATGKKRVFGVDFTTISTVYGDINVARNIHLDGSGVKILGINLSHVKWRPLSGNGVNRDTSVYVGVQTLENTGTDKRVDMILTEGGFEWSMPECHAIWK